MFSCANGYGFYLNSDTIVTTNHGTISNETDVGTVVWRDKGKDIAFIQANEIHITSVPECSDDTATFTSNNLIQNVNMWRLPYEVHSGQSGSAMFKGDKLVGMLSGYYNEGGDSFGASCRELKSELTEYLYSFHD
jgi:hypothetical protein